MKNKQTVWQKYHVVKVLLISLAISIVSTAIFSVIPRPWEASTSELCTNTCSGEYISSTISYGFPLQSSTVEKISSRVYTWPASNEVNFANLFLNFCIVFLLSIALVSGLFIASNKKKR